MGRRALNRTFLPEVFDDLRDLAESDERLVDVALQAVTDLAEHRKKGKALGVRHVSGDLTTCYRLRFDLAGQKPERFRIVYQLLPTSTQPSTIEVISIGPRGGHVAYQAAVVRLIALGQ